MMPNACQNFAKTLRLQNMCLIFFSWFGGWSVVIQFAIFPKIKVTKRIWKPSSHLAAETGSWFILIAVAHRYLSCLCRSPYECLSRVYISEAFFQKRQKYRQVLCLAWHHLDKKSLLYQPWSQRQLKLTDIYGASVLPWRQCGNLSPCKQLVDKYSDTD